MSSRGTVKRERAAQADAPKETTQPTDDKALLESKPDGDRMGEIADRLLYTRL